MLVLCTRVETESRAVDAKVTCSHLDVAQNIVTAGEEVLGHFSRVVRVAFGHGSGDMVDLRGLVAVGEKRWRLLGVKDCRAINIDGRTLLLRVKVAALLEMVMRGVFLKVMFCQSFAVIGLRVHIFYLLDLFLPALNDLEGSILDLLGIQRDRDVSLGDFRIDSPESFLLLQLFMVLLDYSLQHGLILR